MSLREMGPQLKLPINVTKGSETLATIGDMTYVMEVTETDLIIIIIIIDFILRG